MKIAVVQMDCIPGDVSGNTEKICRLIDSVKPVDLIVFPELVDTGYLMSEVRQLRKSAPMRETLEKLSQAVRKRNFHLVIGIAEIVDQNLYNIALLMDNRGEVIARYQKIHLYTPSGEDVFSSGNKIIISTVHGYKVGLMICYDTRFPEMARSLALAGADVLITPTAWPFPRVEHWQLLTRVRAMENQCYFVGANRVGVDGKAIFCGNSRIIDPHGVVIAAASEDQEEVLYAEINRTKLDFVRSRMPIFDHRRPDVYIHDKN